MVDPGQDSGWASPREEERLAYRSERIAKAMTLVRRSTLIVPANVPRFVEKAHLRAADAVMLDLEDAVPVNEKAGAREMAREAIPLVARGGADVLVRINKPFELAVRDLDAVVCGELTGLFFPKVESAREVIILDALIAERELKAGIPIGTLQLGLPIESAAGLTNAISIATASERIVTMTFGSEDVTLELGIEPTAEGKERFYGNARLVMVAAHAGLQAHGRLGNVADYTNLDAWTSTIQDAKQFGFKGSTAIHPDQIPILNREFSLSEAEIDHARRVIKTYEEAESRGRASTTLDGKMIDIPTAKRARLILKRAEAIARKDAVHSST